MLQSLAEMAVEVLATADGRAKTALGRRHAAAWFSARAAGQPMPLGFYDDWVKAADEEAKHFNLICDCLEALDSHYGARPRIRPGTFWRGSPSCPWCWRRAGWA